MVYIFIVLRINIYLILYIRIIIISTKLNCIIAFLEKSKEMFWRLRRKGEHMKKEIL